MRNIILFMGILLGLIIGCLINCTEPYYDKPDVRIDYYIDTIQNNVILTTTGVYNGNVSISSVKLDTIK